MKATRSISALAIKLMALPSFMACAHSGHITFQSTDSSFHPRSRASAPDVYRRRDSVPHVALRSVGIIEVSGSEASARAAAKGQELGCWALIEHSIYDDVEPPVPGEHRSSVDSPENDRLFGHGTMHAVSTVKAPSALRFDCVMLETPTSPAPLAM